MDAKNALAITMLCDIEIKGNKNHKCSVCGKLYKLEHRLYKHITESHDTEIRNKLNEAYKYINSH